MPETEATLSLPAGTRRLFPGHGDLGGATSTDFLIGRLLEDGDGADLTWLFATLGETRVGRWFRQRGGRQLSRRSRLFWGRVLEVDSGTNVEIGGELWPL